MRLGWEFNGNWFAWSCTVPADYIACFRHVVQAIRKTDPQATFDWTANAHYSQNPPSHNANDCYPGDDVVDIIGLDSYDEYPPSPNESAWDSQCNGSEGLCGLITFAQSHGKKFSVGEWGVVSGDGSNGGQPASSEGECQTPGDCETLLGPLPRVCIDKCPSGNQGCEHYLCLSGICQTSYCD